MAGSKRIYPANKGFRRHHPLWYRNNENFTDSEKLELLEYLKTIFAQLRSEDNSTVRWQEVGVCQEAPLTRGMALRDTEGLQGEKRLEYIRKKTLDDITWRLANILRYTFPIRLGEAVEVLERCWEVHRWMNPAQALHYDVTLCIYLTTARELRGGDEAYYVETLKMLPPSLLSDSRLGPRNFILGCCTLARLYRHLGRNEEEKVSARAHRSLAEDGLLYPYICRVRKIAEWIDRSLQRYQLTPYEFLQNMDKETMGRVIKHLGRDPFDGIINKSLHVAIDTNFETGNPNIGAAFVTAHEPALHYGGDPLPDIPLEVDKRPLRRECWVSGCRTTERLRRCAACSVALYCSSEHQWEAWPRHKQLCDRYKDERALYQDLD